MNFELKNLFMFQSLIVEMQSICVKIKDPVIRLAAIERVDKLIEIYKTFDRYYYEAHFNRQKILFQQNQIIELSKKMAEIKAENEKLLKSLEWQQ